MKRMCIYIIGVAVGLVMAALVATGCTREHKAAKTAKAFLQAYYAELDFSLAESMATQESLPIIKEREEVLGYNPYAKSEAPDIVFKGLSIDKENPAKAQVVYLYNRTEKNLYLQKKDGEWKVDLQEERRQQEVGMQQLSTSKQGGFASAASGPVVYKKRKK